MDGYHGFSTAGIAEEECEMQRLEEGYFDMAEISQLYWCIPQPIATLALGSPRRFPRMA